MKIRICLLFVLISFFAKAQYGPKDIAKSDRALWTEPMASSTDFDIASKCEMLVFISVFNKYANYSVDEIKNFSNVKSVNITSVEKWKAETKKILLENFNSLEKESLDKIIKISQKPNWETLTNTNIEKQLSENLTDWYINSKAFYQYYVYEQIRLAALSPKITSEIETLNSNEITGKEFAQKHFLLTFDDGPTPVNGNTDKTMEMLAKYDLHAVFYALGESLQNRKSATSVASLQKLYAEQSLASHGKVHKSHQKMTDWKNSIDFTHDLIATISNKKEIDFRPPYGQRTKEVAKYLEKSNAKIVLWNLDSQDWNQKINATEVANRQITLMLLWRKGILLFHDIHPKAQKAVPTIYNYFKNCKLSWVNSNYLKEIN